MNGYRIGPRNQNSLLINGFQTHPKTRKRGCYQTGGSKLRSRPSLEPHRLDPAPSCRKRSPRLLDGGALDFTRVLMHPVAGIMEVRARPIATAFGAERNRRCVQN